jgi:flavodoxin
LKSAAIVYRSRTGTTRRLAEEIGAYLRTRDVSATVVSVGDCDLGALDSVDYLLLGCWTNGLFVILQHPDGAWSAFTRVLPPISHPRVALFTTYKLVTGSMFGRMRAELEGKTPHATLELKSRDGRLSDRDKQALDRFLSAA